MLSRLNWGLFFLSTVTRGSFTICEDSLYQDLVIVNKTFGVLSLGRPFFTGTNVLFILLYKYNVLYEFSDKFLYGVIISNILHHKSVQSKLQVKLPHQWYNG